MPDTTYREDSIVLGETSSWGMTLLRRLQRTSRDRHIISIIRKNQNIGVINFKSIGSTGNALNFFDALAQRTAKWHGASAAFQARFALSVSKDIWKPYFRVLAEFLPVNKLVASHSTATAVNSGPLHALSTSERRTYSSATNIAFG